MASKLLLEGLGGFKAGRWFQSCCREVAAPVRGGFSAAATVGFNTAAEGGTIHAVENLLLLQPEYYC